MASFQSGGAFLPAGDYQPTGTWDFSRATGLTLSPNTAPGSSASLVGHATYSFAVDGGGAPGLITPASNVTIPVNAIITNCIIDVTTAVTASGSATISVGTSAGSSAASLLAATAKASFTPAGFVQAIPVPQTASTWVKLTAAGQITLTSAVGAITAGVIEIYVFYTVSPT